MANLQNISLSEIRVNPIALRDVNRQSEQYLELVASIKARGVLQSIIVYEAPSTDPNDPTKYVLVDGLQRYTASVDTGKETIPAHITVGDEAQALFDQIAANAVRVETTPIQYSKHLLRILASNTTMSETELAQRINKSVQWVQRMLGLLKLTDAIQPLVDASKIPVLNASFLAKLPSTEQQDWVERAVTETGDVFAAAVNERLKQIRDANRRGEDAGEEQFVPVQHLRKRNEIQDTLKDQSAIVGLVRDLGLTEQYGVTADVAASIFSEALKFTLHADRLSVEKQESDWKAKKDEQKREKARRAQERADKKAADAKEAADKVRAGVSA